MFLAKLKKKNYTFNIVHKNINQYMTLNNVLIVFHKFSKNKP